MLTYPLCSPTHQEVFGEIAAFSNVSLYDGGTLQKIIAQQSKLQNMRIYTDIVEMEDSQFPGVVDSDQKIYNSLLALGFTTQETIFVIDPSGVQNEGSWKRRFPDAWK